jgi:hypothetical protein
MGNSLGAYGTADVNEDGNPATIANKQINTIDLFFKAKFLTIKRKPRIYGTKKMLIKTPLFFVPCLKAN